MKKIFVLAICWCVAFFMGLVPLSAQTAKPVKTLIVTGQDGSHYWRGASEGIEKILENSGLFSVDILETPDFGEDMSHFKPRFQDYGLVVINYGGVTWKKEIQKSFEDYVSKGGGVVIIHSSIIPMENWPAYNLMTGLGAWNGRDERWGPFVYWKDGRYVYDYTPGYAGYHGLQHETVIEHRALEHPILKGLPTRWKHFKDEIYTHLRGPAKNIEILATVEEKGRHEPIMWTTTYGKGRVFVDVLGHCGNDPEMIYSILCTGYQVTLLRGAEWAATGSVTQKVPLDFPLEDTYTLRPDLVAPFHAYQE